jgi:outer membrane protein assembly complex protein YaeT
MAVAAPAGAQSDFPSELQTVERIRFEGRHRVPVKELLSVMKTRASSWLPWRERPVLRLDFLRADTAAIAAIYRQHGYLDAHADVRVRALKQDVNRAEVTFEIQEGGQSLVHAIEFTGVHVYSVAQLRQKLYLKRGRPFNPSALIADTSRVAEAYQERGYRPRVEVDTLRRGNDITCTFRVTEGPLYRFGETYWSSPGVVTVKRSLVQRELDMKPGDIYRRSRIQRTVENLYATDLFRSVQVTPLPDSANALMEIDMRLEERKRRWIDAGIGSGTFERFNVSAGWGHRNLLGSGLSNLAITTLALDGNANFLQWRSELSLISPWLLGTRTVGQATAYYVKSDDRVTDSRWVLHQSAPGVRFQLRREFSRILKLTATQDNAFVRQSASILADTSQALRDSIFSNVPRYYTTHLFNLTLNRDLRDDPFITTRGSTQTISGEVAGGPLQGSSSYAKGQIASAWFTPVQKFWVLAFQVRTGIAAPFGNAVRFSPNDSLVDPDVARIPLENRFRLGGVNSVRGFDDNALVPPGGLAMFQANAELRIPLAGPFGVEIYADGGNVWPGAANVRVKDFVPYAGRRPVDPGDVRYVFGFGPRLLLPFGPLRLDLTWSPRPIDPVTHHWFVHQVQFAIGPSF